MNENIQKFERDGNGLYKHINYILNEDKTINWRAMVPKKYIYPNPQQKDKIEKILGKSINEYNSETDKLDDNLCCVLLSGIKYLANLRGVLEVDPKVVNSSPEYASVTCRITYTDIYETDTIVYADSACATLNNTNGFGQNYLVEIASNRAYCRAVRGYLNLNIVSKEELGKGSEQIDENRSNNNTNSSAEDPIVTITKKLKSLNYKTLDDAHKLFTKYGNTDFTKYKKLKEIPQSKLFEFLEFLCQFQDKEKNETGTNN